MVTLLVVLVVVALALIALLWVTTLWAQSYFYDSPTEGLTWRAPAAAGAMTALFFLWALIEYSRPNTTDTIFRFSTQRSEEYDRFISIRKGEEGEQEIKYHKVTQGAGKFDFRDDKGRVWTRSSSGMMVAIILEERVDEGGESKTVPRRFDAEMTADGKFNPRISSGIQQVLRYHENGGDRFIVEDQIGKVFHYRRSLLFYNVFLNLIHLVLWFVVAWMLLHFQWPHALILAIVAWLIMTIVVLPYVLSKAREAGEKRLGIKPTASLTYRDSNAG